MLTAILIVILTFIALRWKPVLAISLFALYFFIAALVVAFGKYDVDVQDVAVLTLLNSSLLTLTNVRELKRRNQNVRIKFYRRDGSAL